MLVAPAEGVGYMLTTLFTVWRAIPPAVRLYTNDLSPTILSSLASFTQADFPGYDRILLSNPVRSVDIVAGSIKVEWDPVVFQPTSSLKTRTRIYGYYVTDFLGAFCLWAERFPVRVYLQDPTESISFIPTLGMLSEFTG